MDKCGSMYKSVDVLRFAMPHPMPRAVFCIFCYGYHIFFLENMPHNANGKIDKKMLQKIYGDEMQK